jgi:plastocyanin
VAAVPEPLLPDPAAADAEHGTATDSAAEVPERPIAAPATVPAAPEPVVSAMPEPAPVAAEPLRASLSGQVRLVQVHEIAAGPALLSRTWVAFRPRTPVRVEPAAELRILTRQSQFQPQAMAIPVGTTVRFPNLDRILHNVFSLTPGNSFDVGLYGPGAGEAHRFERAGFVDIYCNIHPNMAAFLWVLDTPYFAQVNSDGSFRLDDVPAVGGVLEVWNHRADILRIPAVAPDDSLRATLRITLPPVPQHTNKLGEDY